MEEAKMPIAGPSSLEEALTDIEKSEREIDAHQGTSWDVVKDMMAERIYSYANQVY